MILVDPAAASAASPEAEGASANAVAPSSVRYALTLVEGGGTPVTDLAALRVSSIVRVLRGAHAGVVGIFYDLDSGFASIEVVAPELKRRRRCIAVQVDSALRLVTDSRQAHRDPKVGDEARYWNRTCRVCSIDGGSATVRMKSRHPTEADRVETVDLCLEQPVLEVLFEPVMRLADGGILPLEPTLAYTMGNFLLDALFAATT